MSDTAGPDGLAPRQPRQNVLLGAEICGFGGGTPTKHRVRDLSSTGARVDRAGALKPGATVLVSVGVLDQVGATVVWVKGDSAGLKFAEAIDPDAARSRAIVAPSRAQDDSAAAGWLFDQSSPYRK